MSRLCGWLVSTPVQERSFSLASSSAAVRLSMLLLLFSAAPLASPLASPLSDALEAFFFSAACFFLRSDGCRRGRGGAGRASLLDVGCHWERCDQRVAAPPAGERGRSAGVKQSWQAALPLLRGAGAWQLHGAAAAGR